MSFRTYYHSTHELRRGIVLAGLDFSGSTCPACGKVTPPHLGVKHNAPGTDYFLFCNICWHADQIEYDDASNMLLMQLRWKALFGRSRKKNELSDDNNYVGGVRLFRLWYFDETNWELKAIAHQHVWQPGINVCNNVPTRNNRDGFYGFNHYNQMRLQEQWGTPNGVNLVGGSFISWGRIVTADQGARVENARIESIIEPKDMPDSYLTILPSIADKYGVRIISEEMAGELKAGLIPYVQDMEL